MLWTKDETGHEEHFKLEGQLAIQYLLLATYLSVHLVFRWLKWPLFSGYGPHGWPQPEGPELGLLIMSNLLHAWLLVYLLFRLVSYTRTLAVNICVVATFFLGLTIIELDLAWYQISSEHIRWVDVEIFLTEDWEQHFGIQSNDIYRNVVLALIHLVAVTGIVGISYLLAAWIPNQIKRWASATKVGATIVTLCFLDLGITGYKVMHEAPQWLQLMENNPIRLNLVSPVLEFSSPVQQDLTRANAQLSALVLEVDNHITRVPNSHKSIVGHDRPDVLIVIVEGFNPSLVTKETMPYLTQLSERATVSPRHYATGNITAYGVLGLLFGEPNTFYAGDQLQYAFGSPYLNLFTENGYRSKQITDVLLNYRHMGKYMENFTEPAAEDQDHWKLLPLIVDELRKDGPSLVVSQYYGSHYPYAHAQEFSRFQPEVPEDYNYSSWDLVERREEVINRYRNCLLEADAWFEKLVGQIDLSRTVIVVTGDHGEEFFETNRLSHAATLMEPQIHVPFLLYVPGREPTTLDSISSHLDIMPTLVDILGWEIPPPRYGESLLDPDRLGAAIVTKNNGKRLPNTWGIITEAGKTIVRFENAHGIEIDGFFNETDQRVVYGNNPAAWRRNLEITKLLESDLLAAKYR